MSSSEGGQSTTEQSISDTQSTPNKEQQLNQGSDTQKEGSDGQEEIQHETIVFDIEKAEECKKKGNDLIVQLKYSDAIDCYTEAIKLGGNDKKVAIYYSNRAFCHLKLEAYGSCIEDASKSVQYDPTFAKGYYRQGLAYLSLVKLDEAKNCFAQCSILTQKKDKDIEDKLKLVKKLIFEREFAKAVEVEEKKVISIEDTYKDLVVPKDYDGPVLENEQTPVTPEWCESLMKYLKEQKKLSLKYLINLLVRAKKILREQPTLVEFNYPDNIEMTVCGDTHGQFYDLLNIFKLNGNPSTTNPYLFNGDFVDRGSFSVEVIVTLLAWKVCNPESMHLTRGNHETINMNKMYGFEGEVLHKYNQETFQLFTQIFQSLPLVYILNKKVQVNHGGLFSNDGVKLDDLKKIDRFMEPPDQGLMTDLLWSDPVKINGRHPSKRGVSIGFGPDVAKKYLQENGLSLLVRSHEMKQEGYEEEADGKVITIFSAPNYCDQMGNKGAFIRFLGSEMKPKYTQFSAVEHPKIPPMKYSSSFYNMY